MKMTIVTGMGLLCGLMAGCGAVEIGEIPVDVGGITNNFGDINLGETGGADIVAAFVGDQVSEAVDDIADDDSTTVGTDEAEASREPRHHPADVDGDFRLTSDEILSYSVAFQNGELPEEQDEQWLSVAVAIWQATFDGAYIDDLESPEPFNWAPAGSQDQGASEPEPKADDPTGIEGEDNANNETTESASEIVPRKDGFDLFFELVPLSSVPVSLKVIDPNGHQNTDWQNRHELGWSTGAAWRGVYTVHVDAGDNYNGVNERVAFGLHVYVDGELFSEAEYSMTEGSSWDDLLIRY